jgi:crotonobetainyl-CoA:carnitine CoA-transferase CaiB-like acyl-CoA transferase
VVALDGIRVVELSDREEAAAYCAKLLARWGAEVIKVERPDREAPERAADLYLNGGKQRVALDYRKPEDRERLAALAASADVLVTDAPACDVEAHGLLDLGGGVAVSITPFGLDGPYRDWEATPATLLALGGYTWLMGDAGRAPLTMPGRYPYYQAGTFAYIAALSALLAERREPGAAPRTVEVSVLECLATLHQFTDTMWTFNGIVRSRHGNRWENLCPTTLLRCADGWYGMNILQNFWFNFAQWIGRPEAAEEGHPWATNPGRMQHQDEVEAAATEALGGKGRLEILREGQEMWRVPVGHLATLADVLSDPHVESRGFWRPMGEGGEAATDGTWRLPGSPFRFLGEERPVERPVSPVGHDTREVLAAIPAPAQGARRASLDATTRPLEGIRVVDLTRIWSGPLATRTLGDLGAEVVKIEAHAGRGTGALGADMPGDARPWNRQGLFNKLNRNKQSVALDLKAPEGRELLLRLVAESDVVIENFSARAMPSLGLGYEALREANPAIVYVAMPAFGLEGPYRDYVGLGPSVEPTTGLTALMGYSDDEPRVTAKAIADAMAGTTATAAVLTALARRARTGEGALIDLSQHECGIAFLGEYFVERQLAGHEPERTGNAHREWAPHGVYRCEGDDDWIAIAARDDREWAALCELAGRGWERDPRFGDLAARRANHAALDAEIEAWTADQSKAALMHALQARGVAAGAVLSAPEWLAEPHLEARGYFVELEHEETGRGRWDGSPLRLDGARGYEGWRAAPLLGEHNASVLRQVLGLPADEIASLEARGVIADRPPVAAGSV